MKTILRRSFFIVSLVATTLVSSATDYYVSTTGNNSALGTSPGTAWLTLQYACRLVNGNPVLQPGDVIHLGQGTFRENGQINIPVGVSIIGNGSTGSNKTTIK